MSRYTERAENTARILDVNYQTSLMPQSAAVAQSGWEGLLAISELTAAYKAKHGEVTQRNVLNFMVRDMDNPSSIASCLRGARENARAVRGTLTTEVWETQNITWLELSQLINSKTFERDPTPFFEWVKFRSHVSRGVAIGTMLQDESFHFLRMGTFLERADNTARILDVKYYVLLPSVRSVGSSIDNVQWETILRSVSARGGFRMEYGNQYDPRDIAHFLILDKRMPRSLAFCLAKIRTNLGYLSSTHGTRSESWHLADATDRRFMTHDIDAIFDFGLHEFVEEVIGQIAGLGRQIEIDYRFYE
jgi:uncharacterized alpha-E superfamily protein